MLRMDLDGPESVFNEVKGVVQGAVVELAAVTNGTNVRMAAVAIAQICIYTYAARADTQTDLDRVESLVRIVSDELAVPIEIDLLGIVVHPGPVHGDLAAHLAVPQSNHRPRSRVGNNAPPGVALFVCCIL